MRLQLAIDDIKLQAALKLAEDVRDYVDILEMGSPFIMEYGMEAVRIFRKAFPEKEILADLKIMDAGYFEAELAFAAGADYATVLGVTDDATIIEAQRAAEKYSCRLFIDMICVDNVEERVRFIEVQKVYGISVHTGVDQQKRGRTALDDLKQIIGCRDRAAVSVAGGINGETAADYITAGADVVIVGGGIIHAADPKAEAMRIACGI